jgi:hypothetical protein
MKKPQCDNVKGFKPARGLLFRLDDGLCCVLELQTGSDEYQRSTTAQKCYTSSLTYIFITCQA